MPLDENREIIRRFNEVVWGKGRLELVNELFSADFVNHSSSPGGPPGRDGVRQEVERVRSAFPDLVITTGDIICEGDRAALRWLGEGTHAGGIPGRTGVGKRISISGMHFYRLRNGQIVEQWAEFDAAAVMRQLGGT